MSSSHAAPVREHPDFPPISASKGLLPPVAETLEIPIKRVGTGATLANLRVMVHSLSLRGQG
jgi:hypothetical protein